jgi:hypothetical protein
MLAVNQIGGARLGISLREIVSSSRRRPSPTTSPSSGTSSIYASLAMSAARSHRGHGWSSLPAPRGPMLMLHNFCDSGGQ